MGRIRLRTSEPMWFALDDPDTCSYPTRAHESDAGYDLALCDPVRLERDHITMCHTGVRAQLPEGCFGLLCVRSSLGRRGVMMATGCSVIDNGYRGEIAVPLVNLSDRTVALSRGERVAQLVVVPYWHYAVECVPASWLSETDRGEGGFGSSGR